MAIQATKRIESRVVKNAGSVPNSVLKSLETGKDINVKQINTLNSKSSSKKQQEAEEEGRVEGERSYFQHEKNITQKIFRTLGIASRIASTKLIAELMNMAEITSQGILDQIRS